MNQDQLRAEIDRKLGWTSNPERAVSWDEAVTAAMEVVAPLLAERDEQVTLLKWLHAEVAWQVERLHSWAGLMELLDEHWPAEVFTGDSEECDSGPRIVSLIRAVDRVEASRRDWATEDLRLQELLNRATEALQDLRDRVAAVNRAQGNDLARRLLETVESWQPPQCSVHPEGGGRRE